MSVSHEFSVSIITVTYNASTFIHQYLQSIEQLFERFTQFSVVLVDNASSDNTVSVIETFIQQSAYRDRYKLCPETENHGFGRGCNLGVQAAKPSDYLWFLNPDTAFESQAAIALVDLLSTRPEVSVVGSELKNEHGEQRPGAFRFPGVMTTFLSHACFGLFDHLFKAYALNFSKTQKPQRVEWLSGASFMIRRSAFEAVEGFDPNFFLYFEEVDLFFQLHRKGLEAWSCPQSFVFHISGASTGINQQDKKGLLPRKPAYWFESRRYFYLKNYGRLYFLMADIALIMGQLLHRFKNFCLRKVMTRPRFFIRDILRYGGWR